VTVIVEGNGRVTDGGISCPGRCKATIAPGAKLTLRACAARGYRFARWSGTCRARQACTLHPKAPVKITATFRKRQS
jgi:Divergent InlB B-repeat domain